MPVWKAVMRWEKLSSKIDRETQVKAITQKSTRITKKIQVKSILITGSTDGIGKLAAKKLAEEGHTIFLHGRNKEKIESCVNEIRKASGSITVFGSHADLSNL